MSKNKNKNKNKPSLDLSFAYGTTIIKRLSAQDIRMFEAAEAAADDAIQSDDPTVRTVTSLFTGTRGITGIGHVSNDAEIDDDSDDDET